MIFIGFILCWVGWAMGSEHSKPLVEESGVFMLVFGLILMAAGAA